MNGYFNSIFNPGAASPSSFTAPGMNPQALAQLLQMQGGTGQPPQMTMQPPQMGMPPQTGMPQQPQPMTPGAQMQQPGMPMNGGMGAQSSNPLGADRMAQIYQLLQKMGGGAPGSMSGQVPTMARSQLPMPVNPQAFMR